VRERAENLYGSTSMRMRVLIVLATWTLLAADRSQGDAVKKEWKNLEGTWMLVRMESDGKSLLEKDRPFPRIAIKDGKITALPKDTEDAEEGDSWKIQLDPTRKPKTVTVPNFKSGDPKQGVTLIGIYELNGDQLRVCAQAVETAKLKEREKERPRAFSNKQGVLLVFKRQRK
jgi:uncharacterized protein (TIGR03067 family)